MHPLNLSARTLLPFVSAAALLASGSSWAAPKPEKSAEHAFGPQAAQEALKKFTVPEGLEVTLFASEPMVRNPADMDIDSRGRVWITEGVNYRRWSNLDPKGDRIVILEDTNGDGLADKETTFYQGTEINSALGICVLGNKVIVSCSPNVFVFTDTDGDGKSDKKEVLFTGISGVQHDHGVHAFVFGPDGKLYFNMGNEGKQIKRGDGSRIIDVEGHEVSGNGKPYRQGMAFRCNLDGSSFETLGYNFRNNYEVSVDSFGRLWQSDNDDDGNKGVRINYVMDHGNFGYTDEMNGAGWGVAWAKAKAKGAAEDDKVFYEWHQYDPGVVPNLLNTGAGSPTGITVYEGDLLPEKFRNQVIHCDAGPRVVRAYPVKPDGAGFKAEMVDILTTPDSWFRPSDVCVAPDGSIFVADWNDPGVGGHNMQDRDVTQMTGRIYRVAPKGSKLAVPKLDLNSKAGAVAALQSPNLATRYLAWTKLEQMGASAESALVKVWHGNNPRMRARAFQLLARIPGKGGKYLDEALKDRDPEIRALPLRFARVERIDAIPFVQKLVKDGDASVRRECALSLRHNPSSEAARLWAELAKNYAGNDRWHLEALGIGADQQWDAFLSAWLAQVGEQWNTPAGREIVWRSRSKQTPGLLVKLISDKNTPEKDRERYFRSLDFIKGPEKDAALLELLSSSAPSK